MLTTLLIWVYALVLFYLYGIATAKLATKIFDLNPETKLPFPIMIVLGMAILTTIASYLSIFLPLGVSAAVLFLVGAIFIAIWLRPSFKIHLQPCHFFVWTLILLSAFIILESALNTPINPDTALYHAQTIRWTETYPAIPGIANIHYRLAENSSWLVISAAFSFAFLGIQSFHLLGSVFALVALLYFGQGFEKIAHRQIIVSSIAKSILFFLIIYLYRQEVSSPGTDLPATLLIWIVTVLALEKLETGNLRLDIYIVAIFIFSIFALTIKLFALPLAAIAFLIVLQQIVKKDLYRWMSLIGIGIFILLPWLVRNVITSGYLIFPVTQIDIFSFDWKYPRVNVESDREGIIWFARFPNKNWATYIGLPFSQWVPLWFDNLTLNQEIIFMGAIASPLGFLFLQLLTGAKLLKNFYLLYLVIYAGVIFWFLSAPNIRFGYGFLTTSIVLIASPFILIFTEKTIPHFSLILASLFFMLILYQGYTLFTTSNPDFISQHLILPADYLPSRAISCPIHNTTIYCRSVANQCNYEIFPCIFSPQPNVEMRGPTFANGFRQVP